MSVDPLHIIGPLAALTSHICGHRANSGGIIIDPTAKSTLSFYFKRPDGTSFSVRVAQLTEDEYDQVANAVGVEENT